MKGDGGEGDGCEEGPASSLTSSRCRALSVSELWKEKAGREVFRLGRRRRFSRGGELPAELKLGGMGQKEMHRERVDEWRVGVANM